MFWLLWVKWLAIFTAPLVFLSGCMAISVWLFGEPLAAVAALLFVLMVALILAAATGAATDEYKKKQEPPRDPT